MGARFFLVAGKIINHLPFRRFRHNRRFLITSSQTGCRLFVHTGASLERNEKNTLDPGRRKCRKNISHSLSTRGKKQSISPRLLPDWAINQFAS